MCAGGRRFYVNQLVAGRLDSQLPPLGPGSPAQQRHKRDLDQFMKRFKMQAWGPLALHLACSHPGQALRPLALRLPALHTAWRHQDAFGQEAGAPP